LKKMCLLFFSYKTTPGYKLVIAANRDEFLQRPTASLNFIDRQKQVLAGLDLQGGGTWLGITRSGKIAALTNYRGGGRQGENTPSRGDIVSSYLHSKVAAIDFLEELQKKSSQYNGFNLLLGDGENLYYYTSQREKFIRLEPGFYGLSNHFIDTPWPKLIRGKELLRPVMVETERVDCEKIFSLLRDDRNPQDRLLPDTGVGLEWERLLGTIFIDSPEYGTRSSAVITIGYDDEAVFTEITYHRAKGRKPEIVQMSFDALLHKSCSKN